MARSSYIYLVCHDAPATPDGPHVVAAFTVKHEMLSWMERCTHRYKDEFNVYRTRDNPRGHAPDEKPDVTPFNE